MLIVTGRISFFISVAGKRDGMGGSWFRRGKVTFDVHRPRCEGEQRCVREDSGREGAPLSSEDMQVRINFHSGRCTGSHEGSDSGVVHGTSELILVEGAVVSLQPQTPCFFLSGQF